MNENGQVESTDQQSDTIDNGVATTRSNDVHSPSDEQENTLSSESEALTSERAASIITEGTGIGSPRVQFEKIQEEDVLSSLEGPLSDEERKSRRHHSKHHDYK